MKRPRVLRRDHVFYVKAACLMWRPLFYVKGSCFT